MTSLFPWHCRAWKHSGLWTNTPWWRTKEWRRRSFSRSQICIIQARKYAPVSVWHHSLQLAFQRFSLNRMHIADHPHNIPSLSEVQPCLPFLAPLNSQRLFVLGVESVQSKSIKQKHSTSTKLRTSATSYQLQSDVIWGDFAVVHMHYTLLCWFPLILRRICISENGYKKRYNDISPPFYAYYKVALGD